jgi:hypothetical protein
MNTNINLTILEDDIENWVSFLVTTCDYVRDLKPVRTETNTGMIEF